MPLEATVMVIDNSEYMRNGDYQPTRFEAQADAVNVVFQTKTDSNPENTVGLMTSGGKCPEVLVTHTKDLGQILQGIHVARQKLSNSIDVPTAINIAQLALKHRENKNLRQRILVFVGSPIHEVPNTDSASMIKLAKKLKKNNVAVDVVCFGDGIEEEDEEGKTVLKSFVENVNSGDNSHLVCIPPDALLLSDALINSAVLAADRGALIPEELQVGGAGAGGEGAGAGGAGAGGAGFEFGVDPSLDPELAMALRLSMQEAEARDAVANAGSSSGAGAESAAVPPAAPEAAAGAAAAGAAADAQMDEDDDEEELRKALALSKGEGGDEDVEMDDEEDEDEDEDLDDDEEDGEGEDEDEDDEDEDAAIQRAIQMSMETQKDEESKGGKK